MPARHVLVVTSVSALLLTLLSPAAAATAVTAWSNVTVRVYDQAGLPAATTEAALGLAGATLSSASIEVGWRLCAPRGQAAAACDSPLKAGELVIRILRLPVPAGARAVPLGDALIDSRAGAGVLATIYFDRVAALARAARIDLRILLGRAIAHEMGHLLLATSAHSAHGLMRPIWFPDELRHNRAADWTFTAPDLAAIRARAGSPRAAESVVW